MSGFVHLHLHSEYSLLDGACRIEQIPQRAKECGHTAVALTDHGVMYGALTFYRACRDAGIKPIIGCEVYVAPGSRYDKTGASKNGPDHLVLLCENMTGYKNLIDLVSRGFTEGFYSKPRVDRELLESHTEGLIALSACLCGKIPRALSKGDFEGACETARDYAAMFGKDHFYIELQNHGLQEQRQLLPQLVRLAKTCGLPTVATNDCHYLRRKDAADQAILLCVQTNTVITDGRPIGFETDEFYYKDTNEMTMLFGQYEDAIANTVKIADMCNLEFELEKVRLPHFPCPAGLDAETYLSRLVEEGFSRRVAAGDLSYSDAHPEKEYRERAAYELSVINKMGYADYFLIVQEYVNFAKSRDIPVGPGRGSGAGSLVAYLIGITDVDSIRFDLLFERFLNPERVSMPDIDVDFCYNRRDEVIGHMVEKYGRDHVSQIITFGTLAARAAVRDVGRALGMSYSDVDAVAKAIPQEIGITIAQAKQLPELKSQYEESEQVRRLIDTASALEGMPRNMSVHAAGIVVTDQPVASYVPLAVSNGTVVTQFDMDTVAHLGLLKFDFLALRYLTILHDAELQIRETRPDFDLRHIPIDDAETYVLIGKGQTGGVFQLESAGMRQMLMNLRPENIDDIQAAIALYRPGPMDSIPRYIEGKHDPSKITYAIPELEPILRSTCGCIVYQEQVMSICRSVAGFTYGHADIVRRAMAKKKAEALEAERQAFLDGAEAGGINRDAAEDLFEDMSSFANYAFNKSHAAAYAMISYQTAYLKAHYPREYMAALLTSVLGNQGKIAEYIAECGKRSIAVLPPDINQSEATFHVSGQNIRFGLLALKNVGANFVDRLRTERKHGAFLSFEDFVTRMAGTDLNKRMVEALIKAGAFDGLGRHRNQLLLSYEGIIERVNERNRNNLSGQIDMFSGASSADAPSFSYPDVPDLSFREKLAMEKEASGMYFSGHLLDGFEKNVEVLRPTPIYELVGNEEEPSTVADRTPALIAGIITAVTVKTTRKDERMAFFTVEDKGAEMECVAFARRYQDLAHMIRVDAAVCVDGTVSVREDEKPKILVTSITELIENRDFGEEDWKRMEALPRGGAGRNRSSFTSARQSDSVPAKPTVNERPSARPDAPAVDLRNARRLYLRLPDFSGELYRKACNLAEIFDGTFPLTIYSSETKEYRPLGNGIALSGYVLNEFVVLLGKENVILK